ncbi:hypothetical protein GVN24_32360 [Rhizobium sp. CRIBSB]|nr:hypothetical protein [Rhizobium sp. CRIBSB]
MLVATLLSLTLTGPLDTDPLAPARDGMAQCYTPNKAARTCRAIGTYEFHADGTITNFAEVLMNESPLVVMRAQSKVYIRDGAECGPVSDSDIREFLLDGSPVGPELHAQLRDVVVAARAANMPDGEYCTVFKSNDDGTMTGVVTIDGKEWSQGDDIVLWVDPAEGWKVAP